MSQPLFINDEITIPVSELTFTACRGSGPGGQNVNKVASKVALRFALEGSTVLDDETRARLREKARARGVVLTTDGELLLTSQRSRDQGQNLADVRERLRELIAAALVRPVNRVATRPSRAAKARRIAGKRHQAERKNARRSVGSSWD